MSKNKWICDGCSEETTSPKFQVYDENFNKQEGVFYCDLCNFIDDGEKIEEENSWCLSEETLPMYGQEVEYSEDGITVEGTMIFLENRTCMMAGIAGGFGYFGPGFATDHDCPAGYGLICDTPKYWRERQ